MNIQQYMEERVNDQLSYYSQKGKVNKNYYLYIKVTQIIAAALLPFFSIFLSEPDTGIKYVIALLGTLITILEGVAAIGKYHEKWVIYRSTAETLKQEKYMFLMRTGDYAGNDANTNFVSKIEFILGKENAGWQQMLVKDNKEKQQEQQQESQENPNAPTSYGSSANCNAPSPQPDSPIAPAVEPEHYEISAPIDPLIGVPATEEEVAEGSVARNS